MLGILCGLESEAKIARLVPGALVACAAARPGKARELAKNLVERGATRLMSFGIAGALEPSVCLGDVFIGTRVSARSGTWACDDLWSQRLSSKMSFAKRGGVYGSEVLVATTGEKDTLYRGTGCAIVDMESQCAAEVAKASQIPLSVVRAVCDDASMNVPPLVMAAIAEDGHIDVMQGLGHLVRHPSHAIDLFYMLRGTAKALDKLRVARSFLE